MSFFIADFYSNAILTVKIRNGQDGFKTSSYGSVIVVERRFNTDGVNSYRLMNGDNNVVISQRREELDEICDFLSIQVDNPLAFLSQDTARQFLGSTGEQEKYRLFMKGVQLQQLHNAYEALKSKLGSTLSILRMKEGALEELYAEERNCRAMLEQCQIQNTLRQQIAHTRVEFAWLQHNEQKKARICCNLNLMLEIGCYFA